MVAVLVIGLIAGWLSGRLMHGKSAFPADMLMGLAGAYIGTWLFGQIGAVAVDQTEFLGIATIGAMLLVGAAHLVFGT